MSIGRAIGTAFKVGTYSVGKLKSIGGLELSAETLDVTCLDSTGDYREFIRTFKDAGEVPLSGFFDKNDTGQTQLKAAFDAGTAYSMSIVFPTTISANWAFNGIVTQFSTGAEVEGAVTLDAAVKVTGQPTLNV